MDVNKFNDKFNKIDGNIYTVEEEITVVNGVYEAELSHDNVNLNTLNVYTGYKLTGDKINTYTTSTPSLAPWKTVIKIFSDISPVYISYETTGDTVEADDINNVQNAIVDTQKNLNIEVDRATNAENTLANNLNAETLRAKISENALNNIISTNKPNWDDKYSKNEVDNKISAVVTNLDYKEHVANFSDIATTYPNPQDGWTVSVDKDNVTYKYNGSTWIPISANSIPLASSTVDGKMSKQDKIDHDDMVSKKHVHDNKSILDVITQNLLNAWNAAYIHISDAVRHITQLERDKWNGKQDNLGYTPVNKAGDTMNGRLTITPGSDGGIAFPNDSFGGSGDTATITLENPNGGEATEMTFTITNDNDDIFNFKVPNIDGLKVNRKTVWNAGNFNPDSKSDNDHTHDDRYYTETECNAKYATKDQVSKAGYGDMLKSTYDTNNAGIVDNSDKLDGLHFDSFSRPFSQGRNYQGTVGGATDLGWKKLFRMTGNDRSGNGSNISAANYYDAGTIIGCMHYRNGNYYQSRTDRYQFQFTIESWGGTSRTDRPQLYIPSGMPDIIRVVKYGLCDYEVQIRSNQDWLHVGFDFFEAGNSSLKTYQYQNLGNDDGSGTVVKTVSNKDRIIHEPLTWNDLEGI